MKIPAKIRKEIVRGLRKEEYDIEALGLVSAMEVQAIKTITHTIMEVIEEHAWQGMDNIAVGVVEAILKELQWGFSNKGWDKKELVMWFGLWDEFWDYPIDYNSFRFLQHDNEDYETCDAIDASIDKLEKIIQQLRQHNVEYDVEHEKKWGKRDR